MSMNYQRQIEKVTAYIGEHLDDTLTLDELSGIACFSKYHFHRVFTAFTGLSLNRYIRWLRLKRAANQLTIDKDKSIIDIAFDAGFESHEAFSRVFKQTCGFSPSEFRLNPDFQIWNNPPHQLPKQGELEMNVEIKTYDERRLAVLEHVGDPNKLGDTVNQLIEWAKAQPMNLKPSPGEAFGYAYVDPRTTPKDEFKFDLGLTIPETLHLTGPVIERRLPKGRYACIMHKGSNENIGDTIDRLYHDWLPKSGEELGDLPCIFSYYNFAHEVAETELLTEIRVLLK